MLQGLASDNRYVASAGYPLRPFKGEVAAQADIVKSGKVAVVK